MSRIEWASGTITLPTAGFARIRKVVEKTDAAVKKALDRTQEVTSGHWSTYRAPDPVDVASRD